MKSKKIICSILYLCATVCYIIAIFNMSGETESYMTGVVWLSIGSMWLCIGSMWLCLGANISKNEDNNSDEEDE